MHVCMYVCMYACMHACMRAGMYMQPRLLSKMLSPLQTQYLAVPEAHAHQVAGSWARWSSSSARLDISFHRLEAHHLSPKGPSIHI